ncbi:hypothetical protein A3J90_01260 [candidate division WOR-1 bacterium RIFOXYC2_FULL_37_10]|uniref:AbiEi antitoxin C-terminal domain-containing protein n=1 Tax=candidate division WOR-1 bacterium RIFOXYB2_FULL_37_13 TaxID=1802579 RepID=A0A1F4ST83_UNCSA|nr:MAG: hypothetical protein A2246_01755 [candidate division WOR-1 bacterium RIFOXYA2_FULL_37_7]OGC23537.1 MAG: hypothetical protein A2310_02925 [candidate division WOR-1 bacterium RIFOXYB2_FULL_37_13]OGC35750.1 MAG: hypothetical protein A3J90_01260 [candidate division WOR-1 bacterium RIFOXYC2_FULL_37_10]
MRNGVKSKISEIVSLVEKLPYFTLDNLIGLSKNKNYLKILLSRYQKAGKLIRLKKGFYTSKSYVDAVQKSDGFSPYIEFVSNLLCEPSYLSLEYVLYEHNILTDVPVNFTSITKNKTNRFINKFGNFFYHKISSRLFCGFNILKKGGLIIYKATKAKALFDYIYLRKNVLTTEDSIKELRLNLNDFSEKDLKEFKKYIKMEKSKKLRSITGFIFK